MLRTFLISGFLTLSLVFISNDLFAETLLNIFPDGSKPNGFIFLLSVFFALIAALAVHELGHLLTGLLLGFRFELFIVFLLGIKRAAGGIKIFLNKNVGYMGGIAATVPTRQDPKNRKKFAIMVLAGPVASLLFAIISFLMVLYTKNSLYSFWLTASAASIGLFFATTLPKKSGVFFTDRARFFRLMSSGHEGQSEEALLQIIAQTTMDGSCKNLSLEATKILQGDKEPFMRFWGHYYEFHYFKDNNLEKEASEAKENLLLLKNEISAPVWKALKVDEA